MSFADVESANIVGYSTYTAQKGFNLCAVNFKNIGEKEEIPIIDLFPGIGNGVKNDNIRYEMSMNAGADYMMVSKGPGSTEYDKYFLYYYSKSGKDKWYKWCNVAGGAALDDKVTIKNGDAFWFVRQKDEPIDLPVSGEVELSASKTVTIKTGFNLIGSFFPAGFAPNDAPYTSDYWKDTVGAKPEMSMNAGADYFMVSKGPGSTEYDKYFFYYYSKSGKDKWYKWCNAAGGAAVSGSILPPGRGMWYVRQGATDTSFEIKKQF